MRRIRLNEKLKENPSPTYILPLPKGGGGFGEKKEGARRKGNPFPLLVLLLPEGGGGFGERKGGGGFEETFFSL